MEGAHHIFILFEIHTGLAADGTVHLRQKGRGDLHKINPAQERSRRKPSDITDHAAAESDQHILSRDPFFDQEAVDIRYGFQRFVLFPR